MYIPRTIHQKLQDHLERKEYTIITGPRQSGKTSILNALHQELKSEGRAVTLISFEDRDILSAINKHPEEIFAFVPRPLRRATAEPAPPNAYLLIDEVQYADDPSNFLKYIFDKYHEDLKIIATGSSAFYMDKKFRDSLAGRKRIFELQTLSFEELLLFKNQTELLTELKNIRQLSDYRSSRSRELMELFSEYLVFGGYPVVTLETNEKEKINLLKELRNAFLKRDIDESGITQADKFYNMLTLLAGQTANLVNRNELSNTIGVDNKTIDKYLYVLQNCFHIDLVRPIHSNLRKEFTKMPKVFFKDAGLRNSALNRFYDFRNRDDQGLLLENYVYKRLSYLYDTDNIRFWRTADKKEVDFVILTSYKKGLAYEVKMKCLSRKANSTKKFRETYPDFPLEYISFDIDPLCTWVLKL